MVSGCAKSRLRRKPLSGQGTRRRVAESFPEPLAARLPLGKGEQRRMTDNGAARQGAAATALNSSRLSARIDQSPHE